MSVVSWAVVGLMAANLVATIFMLGKDRKPLTAGQVAISSLIYIAVIVAIVINRGACG